MKSKTRVSHKQVLWIIASAVLLPLAAWGLWHEAVDPAVGKKYDSGHERPRLAFFGSIPDFTLTERSGRTLRRSDLLGRVWIADFIFTRCAGPCPLMSGRMLRLQDGFRSEPGIRFVSFSVDPEYDRPEVLSRYAEHYQADPDRWLFLTGDKEAIYDLSQKWFHLGVREIPAAERQDPAQWVGHSTKFVLVDRKGIIRGYYDGQEDASLDRLFEDARILLNEGDEIKNVQEGFQQ